MKRVWAHAVPGGSHKLAIRGLRAALFTRFLLSMGFAVVLLGRPLGLSNVISLLSRFLMLDGALACVAALMAAAAVPRLSLWVVPAIDGMVRVVLGAAVQLGPGIPGFPVTALAYLGIVAVVILFDGWSDIVIAAHWRTAIGGRLAHVVFLVAGLALCAIGGGIFVSVGANDAPRSLLVLLSLTQAVLLLTAAFENADHRAAIAVTSR